MQRRTFLKALGGVGLASAVGSPMMRAFADNPQNSSDFYIFIHALGGWDVTLWSDPRWENKGLVNPASTLNTDTSMIKHWVNDTAALDDGSYSFQPVTSSSKLVFGPAIGDLLKHAPRMLVVNGLAMNTVSHSDGQVFVATGRHLFGGRAAQSSIDTMIANEFGATQLLPTVSVGYPSYFIGSQLDSRVIPLRISAIGSVAKSLSRSTLYTTGAERDEVTMVLSEEAKDLAGIANDPAALSAMDLQYTALRNMLSKNLQNDFSAPALQMAHPEFNFAKLRFQAAGATNAAFAIEAFRQNIARCVSFTFTGFDTHFSNYRNQALTQQEMFDTIAALVDQLDTIPHPTVQGAKLSDKTHILVVSDFCRTPQINLGKGRDHYPNGSALILSPKFKGGASFGASDPDQLLPANAGTFSDGQRPIAPPDVLATFVSAFGVQPRKYLRDGEAVSSLVVM